MIILNFKKIQKLNNIEKIKKLQNIEKNTKIIKYWKL